MKKNRMMRLASGLLVAVLLSTWAISGTFAKYVTTESGSDFARVAKWGVEIEAESFALFTTDYETKDSSFTGKYSVSSADATERDDVLAPGTSGTFANIAITGTPEVAVNVAVVPTVAISDNWYIGTEFYCPIVITIGDTAFCGLKYADETAFANAIAGAIAGYSNKYGPNKDLSTIDANFDISWAWAFEDADHQALACDCVAGAQTDVKDTALGDLAADGNELKIEIGVAITVTQID